jgi:hypothetical protein
MLMNESIRRRANIVIICLVFWTIAYCFRFPLPFVDDLYFVGTAINMSQGGDYSNPYCPSLSLFGSDKHFYAHMPGEPFALLLWITAFGISTASFSGFQCLLCGLSSISLALLIDRPGRSRLTTVIICLLIAVALGNSGMRADALALSLFCGGLHLINARSPLRWGICCLCLFLSIISAPNYALLTPLVILYALDRQRREKGIYTPGFGINILIIFVTALTAFFLFLWAINFQLMPFIHTFTAIKLYAESHFSAPFQLALKTVRHGLPALIYVYGIPVTAAGYLLYAKIKKDVLDVKIFWTDVLIQGAAMAAFIETYFSSSKNGTLFHLYCCLLILFLAVHTTLKFRSIGILTSFLAFSFFIFLYGQSDMKLVLSPFSCAQGNAPEIRAEITKAQPTHIFVDQHALRAIYDYKIARNTFDYCFGVPGVFAYKHSTGDFPPGSMVILSEESLPFFSDPENASITGENSGAASQAGICGHCRFIALKIP